MAAEVCAVGGGAIASVGRERGSLSLRRGTLEKINGNSWRSPVVECTRGLKNTWRTTSNFGLHKRQGLLPLKGILVDVVALHPFDGFIWSLKAKTYKTKTMSSWRRRKPLEGPSIVICQAGRDEGSQGSGKEDDDGENGLPGESSKLDWDSAWSRFRKSEKDGDKELTMNERSSRQKDANLQGADVEDPEAEIGKSGLASTAPKWAAEVKEPRLVRGFGGRVRGGKYQMGEGTDRILMLWGNGDAMLIAAGAVMLLFACLFYQMPEAPWRQ